MKKKYIFIMPFLCFFAYLTLTSSSGGINGVSSSGCTCHGVQSNNTLVSITGLPAGGYVNGAVYSLTISVTNNVIVPTTAAPALGLRDGFDLTASAGAFTAVAGTSLNTALEIRHNTPRAPISGTASWTFNWTAPATGSATINFALAGNATNGSGNTSGDQWNKTTVALLKAPPLSVSATNTPIACNGGTANITATGAGGSIPYTYRLNSGSFQTSTLFSGNVAGIYTITVKDATNATASTTLNISQPTALTFAVPIITQPTCSANGSVQITASGGTGSKTYVINPLGPQANLTGSFTSLTPQSYTVTATDAATCTKTSVVTLIQPTCNSQVQLKLYLQGYYLSNGVMNKVLFNQFVVGATQTDCDDITVKLRSVNSPFNVVASSTVRLNTSGIVTCTFPPLNGNFYISVEQRNSITTWSADPVAISSSTLNSYDFTTAANKAYGSNMLEVETGRWAFYSADINQDGVVETNDYALWELDANNFGSGFLDTDLDGDGSIGTGDYSLWEMNANSFVSSIVP